MMGDVCQTKKSTEEHVPYGKACPYLCEWMKYNQPTLHMHSKLTEWNNVGL